MGHATVRKHIHNGNEGIRTARDVGHATVKKHIHNGNEGIRTARDMGHATVKKHIHNGIDEQTTYVLRETTGRTHY